MSSIDDAFLAVPRIDFLPVEKKPYHAVDAPLVIGFGQTSSQPSTVKTMLQWLDPQEGDCVLDVGSGSGWTTALIAHLVGPDGIVFAVEKIPQLVQFGENNCKQLRITNVRFFQAGATHGLPEHGPFDRILVSAAARNVPTILLHQLTIGGRLVIPVKTSIVVIDRITIDSYDAQEHPGFIFVPLMD